MLRYKLHTAKGCRRRLISISKENDRVVVSAMPRTSLYDANFKRKVHAMQLVITRLSAHSHFYSELSHAEFISIITCWFISTEKSSGGGSNQRQPMKVNSIVIRLLQGSRKLKSGSSSVIVSSASPAYISESFPLPHYFFLHF